MVAHRVRGKSSGLKMVEKRKQHLRELIETWLEQVKLDHYVDESQMWEDMIVIRPHSVDSLPLVLLSMLTGWELFVPVLGSGLVKDEDLARLGRILNE
jgi:hypothetical protein